MRSSLSLSHGYGFNSIAFTSEILTTHEVSSNVTAIFAGPESHWILKAKKNIKFFPWSRKIVSFYLNDPIIVPTLKETFLRDFQKFSQNISEIYS